MNWIEKWTHNIEKMKLDIMSTASGFNDGNDDESFWERNKSQMYSYLLFGGCTGLFYILHYQLLFRIFGLMFMILLFSSFVSLSINTFKRGFKWISKR